MRKNIPLDEESDSHFERKKQQLNEADVKNQNSVKISMLTIPIEWLATQTAGSFDDHSKSQA